MRRKLRNRDERLGTPRERKRSAGISKWVVFLLPAVFFVVAFPYGRAKRIDDKSRESIHRCDNLMSERKYTLPILISIYLFRKKKDLSLQF